MTVHMWRDRYLVFIERHDIAWELGMAVLAVAYVIIGFAGDEASQATRPALDATETALTVMFAGEFGSRFIARTIEPATFARIGSIWLP